MHYAIQCMAGMARTFSLLCLACLYSARLSAWLWIAQWINSIQQSNTFHIVEYSEAVTRKGGGLFVYMLEPDPNITKKKILTLPKNEKTKEGKFLRNSLVLKELQRFFPPRSVTRWYSTTYNNSNPSAVFSVTRWRSTSYEDFGAKLIFDICAANLQPWTAI